MKITAYNHCVNIVLNKECVLESNAINIIKADQNEQLYPFENKLYYFQNQGREVALLSKNKFSRAVPGTEWAFEIKDVITFVWVSGESSIVFYPHKNFTLELLKYWLLHIFLPFYFIVEEIYDFLHAGAVEISGKPVLFIADSYGGKSTMTNFFLTNGHTLISDDKVAIYNSDNAFYSVSSYAKHRPYRATEDLGITVDNFSHTPKPIHAIYELEATDPKGEIEIIQLNGLEKFTSLRFSSEINLPFLKKERFHFLMQIAKFVPVFRIKVPWDLKRQSEVYKAIVLHSENLRRQR